MEFYSLDEISNTLFFSLTSILALFWAELYYISIDRADIYHCIVRPVTYAMNTIAIAGVIVCSILVGKYYENDVDYIFLQYTILITTTYMFAAIMFSYYAYVAALELECVPLPISARRNRLFSLRLLACISIFALGLKASATVYMTGRSVSTNSAVSLFLVYFYFFFCEILPICVILTFYRVETMNNETAEDKDNDFYDNVERQAQNTSRSQRFSGSNSSPEVIDAIIARLSLESGFTGDPINRQDNEDEHWARGVGETDELLPPPRGSRRYQNLSF